MERLVNERVRAIRISGIRQFFNKVKDYPGAVSLTIGQPDFATPEHVKNAGKAAIDQNKTTYTANAGLLELRQAISDYVADKYDLHYESESEIITTVGASEAIDLAFRTLLEPGDEVILPGPAYPGYAAPITLAGGVPVYIDTRETGFKMTADQIASHLTDKTKAVILPYPSNPTGCVLSKAEVAAIANVLEDKSVFVVSDEIYSELIYGQEHVSIAAFPGMKEKTLVINGLSKSHAMTGWRMGYILADKPIADQLIKVHQYGISCITSITQYAAIEALTVGKNDAEPMRKAYKGRLDYVISRLEAMGMDVVHPTGAFYVFPSIKKFGLSSEEFALQLLDKERLAAVPGSAFSSYGEGYLRLSYAYSMDVLKDGLDRLERFVARF
ncbi:aminotransferase A [Sporolactobacillus shoreicorticis]|uniref:Aminotransferase n=1 Tax=Sporolactobacillus shoreicorticis TaxID=1923877 RepID=A0ABW5S8A2_9BACL|nr:aminotransferase A [Sporolactobacillus shoreicorticis]MCO7125529.1 aminotransferase A [Sporolactobacillus shoreicorticis]